MSIKQRIFKNSIASILDKISKITEQLLLIPFFIMHWGFTYYGDWLTLTLLPTFFALSNIGFGTATGNTFVLKYVSGDKKSAANTVKTGLRVMHFGIIFIIILSLIILQGLNYLGIFSELKIPSFEAMWSVFFMILVAVVNFYLAIFECFYRVAHKAHIGILFMALSTFIKVGLGIFFLYLGAKALHYAVLIFAVTVFINILYIIYSIKKLNFLEYSKSIYIKDEALYLFRKGLGYFLGPLWQAIYFQGTIFVIRIVLGSNSVVLFNTLRTFISTSSQGFWFVFTSIFPEFQRAVGEKNSKKADELCNLIYWFNLFIAVLATLLFIFFGPMFYDWWTHQKIEVSMIIWILMIAKIIFNALWFNYSVVFQAKNMPYVLNVSGLFVALISVFVTWVCVNTMGDIGAALGMLCFDLMMYLILKLKNKEDFQVSIRKLFKEGKLFKY